MRRKHLVLQGSYVENFQKIAAEPENQTLGDVKGREFEPLHCTQLEMMLGQLSLIYSRPPISFKSPQHTVCLLSYEMY